MSGRPIAAAMVRMAPIGTIESLRAQKHRSNRDGQRKCSSFGTNRFRHLAGLHLLVGIDEKVIETFNAN